MNLVEPNVELITEENPLKRIELCGRTCYMSFDKITEDSSVRFCNMLNKSGHTSVFEHSRVQVPVEVFYGKYDGYYASNLYGLSDRISIDGRNVSANCRDLINIGFSLDEINYFKNANDYYTVRFTTQIAMSRELVRHRTLSFSEQSTRYCNFSKMGLSFTTPSKFEIKAEDLEFLLMCESFYNKKISAGYTPQQARMFLPLITKTEIVITGTKDKWKEFINLRTSKGADPEMIELATKLKNLKGFSLK